MGRGSLEVKDATIVLMILNLGNLRSANDCAWVANIFLIEGRSNVACLILTPHHPPTHILSMNRLKKKLKKCRQRNKTSKRKLVGRPNILAIALCTTKTGDVQLNFAVAVRKGFIRSWLEFIQAYKPTI